MKVYMASYPSLQLGADPEVFLKQGGKLVESAKILPEGEGEHFTMYGAGLEKSVPHRSGSMVRDGMQAEVHIRQPATCRQTLASHMKAILTGLPARYPKVTLSAEQTIELSEKQLAALTPAAQVLGCNPSRNMHEPERGINVDPATYRWRSAGGHIHLGLRNLSSMMDAREQLVPLLDVIVGNTCVLIDRDPLAAKRREVYGRAGEYRLPEHGLEYRTLSNFWIRSYPLMALVMGLARIAVDMLYTEVAPATHKTIYLNKLNSYRQGGEYCTMNSLGSHWFALMKDKLPVEGFFEGTPSRLLSVVDIEKVARAINTNDAQLARETFDVVKDFLMEENPVPQLDGPHPLTRKSLPAFERLAEKGIDTYWGPDIVKNWSAVGGTTDMHSAPGWENFALHTIMEVPQAQPTGL